MKPEQTDIRFRRECATRVGEFCLVHDLFPEKARVGVLVSGGQDSVALLHLLVSGALPGIGAGGVVAVHINHHLRGEESDADQALVAELCRRLGVEVVVDHRPVDKAAGNVQERARELRRAAAREAAARLSLSRVALGHTMDDQVETILYRLGRYGGLRSLRAMVPSDGLLVRPLLCLRRIETEWYCRLEGLPFAVDRGNEYPGYVRTGVRQRVVPAWEEAVPGAVDAAARAAEVAGEIVAVLDGIVGEAEAGCRRGEETWSAAHLLGLTPRMRRLVLHALLLSRPGIEVSRAHVDALADLIRRPGCAREGLGGGWTAVKVYDALCFTSAEVKEGGGTAQRRAEPEEATLPVPGGVRWSGVTVRAETGVRFRAQDGPWETFVDARAVDGETRVRGWRPGDRIHPLGGAGQRKLQDVFTDLRVPVWSRERVPLVVRGESIVWVAGLVTAEGARIVRDTRAIVRLSVEADPGDR